MTRIISKGYALCIPFVITLSANSFYEVMSITYIY